MSAQNHNTYLGYKIKKQNDYKLFNMCLNPDMVAASTFGHWGNFKFIAFFHICCPSIHGGHSASQGSEGKGVKKAAFF